MFVVDLLENGYQKKRRLNQMKGKIVHFIQEDPFDRGFYIICSQEYDERLELEHSHRDEYDMDFERQVEPGIIKIFDMFIHAETISAEGEDQVQRIQMSCCGMRDDEFTFDRSEF